MTTAPPLDIRLLGRFEVLVHGAPAPPLRSKREQWLLALLVLRHRQDTSRRWLATTLWPDNDEEQALFYLRKALSNLRRALGTEGVRIQSPSVATVRLDLGGAKSDVVDFDLAVEADLLSEAVAGYPGPLLPDCDEEWAVVERAQREAAYHEALERLAKMSEPAAAVRWLRRLVATDPYRESACGELMRALAAAGDRAAVTVVYRELQDRLFQDLNTSPSPEIEALHRLLLQAEIAAPAAPIQVRDTGRHLPVPLSDLIGREAAMAEVLEAMTRARLVTLVGAGGVGKTRLAIAVAEAALPRFRDGVWFVDLAALSDPALVPQATARALGIAEESQRPVIESLVQAVSPRSMLIVLDNCEHVAEASAVMAFNLLSTAPELSIVATSRQALDVTGEQIFRVPSLDVPPTGFVGEWMAYESIRLFADRARRVDRDFRLSHRNADDVAEICRQLDGIALAIEMAAARLRSLSVGEIRTRLSDRFRLLKSGNRGALPRQHTLRAAIDWSYDHLAEPERDVLRKMSVFAGGWSLEAAEAIAGDVEELLSGLVDKSLVTRDGTRYRFLETVRQYAHYRLLESGQLDSTRYRHLDYYLSFTADLQQKLMGSDQAHWFAVVDAEHDNLRQALNFCIERPDGGPLGLRLAGALSRFWLTRGHFSEGLERFSAVTRLPSAQGRTRDRARALNGAGLLAWRQSDYAGAVAMYNESLSISREIGDEFDVARALNNLALITRDQGDYAAARAMHEESIEIFRRTGERLIAAICLSNLGVVSQYQGDFAAARAAFEEGLATQRELGDRSATSVTLSSLGSVALDQGDSAYARACHEEGLQIAEELGDRYGYASHLYGLGVAALQVHCLEEAAVRLRESMTAMFELGERTLVTDHFSAFGSLAAESGETRRATVLFAARANLREVTGSPLPKYVLEKVNAEINQLKETMEAGPFEEAWSTGTAMNLEQAIEFAKG